MKFNTYKRCIMANSRPIKCKLIVDRLRNRVESTTSSLLPPPFLRINSFPLVKFRHNVYL